MPALAPETLEEDTLASDDARMVCTNIAWVVNTAVPRLQPWAEVRRSLPEPDFSKTDLLQSAVDLSAVVLGELEVVSDKDRDMMGTLAAMAAKTAKKVEEVIEGVEALPESVSWRQKAIEKLEDLFCAIEDISETAALAASKEFTELVMTKIQDYVNDKSEN